MRVPEIIDLLGGPTPIARALGIPSTTISNWKSRGSIPARYHEDLISISKGKLTAAVLARAHKPQVPCEAMQDTNAALRRVRSLLYGDPVVVADEELTRLRAAFLAHLDAEAELLAARSARARERRARMLADEAKQ